MVRYVAAQRVLHGVIVQRTIAGAGLENIFHNLEDATMRRVKQASKAKRVTKAAAPALGAAGLTLSLVGGASASAVPTADVQPNNFSPSQAITMLSEGELA